VRGLSIVTRSKGETKCLLDAMFREQELGEKDCFSDEEILDEAITFFAVCDPGESFVQLMLSKAGFGTSSHALAFAVHFLAQHPDVTERIHEETVAVCGENFESVSDEQVEQLE
jgi:cytochrome P450